MTAVPLKQLILHINTSWKKTFWVFIVLLFAGIVLYGFLVKATISNIVARTEAEQNIAHLNAEIGELEARYGDRQSVLTQEYARTLGFFEPREKTFAAHEQLVTTNTSGF